jgi:hypothetical protein
MPQTAHGGQNRRPLSASDCAQLGHGNSRGLRRVLHPSQCQQSDRPSDLLCRAASSCGRGRRQVAGGGAASLACSAFGACPCCCRLSTPWSAAPTAGPAQSACSARNGLSTRTPPRSRLGAQAGPPPCHRALTLPTTPKPEVNLDCVPVAARGCALRAPQKISTTRL